jgi:Kef-type K+ transport system membrane component KefB/mannitol/fructose-specific phosphotransferase system IIA component (Ntr-type)
METESITGLMAALVLQLGVVLFAVRFLGRMASRIKIHPVLGELLAGIIIGPYALGGISLPGFPHGLFPLTSSPVAVSTELYAFATVASVVLLFVAGLETNIRLFLRYSLMGGIISLGGVIATFIAGDLVGMLLFKAPFLDPRCLFLGLLPTANSLGIIARILSDSQKMDAPESVTIMATSVFDDVFTIIVLTVVLGIISAMTGGSQSAASLTIGILIVAGKALGIWAGCTLLGLLFAKTLAGFLKLFKSTYAFSILALGLALILAGIFEKQGLAMIIGAYIAGLTLSKTDIAPVILERIHGIHHLFVPVFFAVMGMMVNYRDIISPPVLVFGGIYSAAVIASKLIGCGIPAMLLGFNIKGSLRIGFGMSPRGEMTLIIAGIGLAMGIITSQLSAVLILMVLITSVVAPSFLNLLFKLSDPGTREPVKADDSVTMTWEFSSRGIADLVINTLLTDLRSEGFYVQMMHLDDGLSQARKNDISISINKSSQNTVTIKTARADMAFVKTTLYEVIVQLYESFLELKEFSNPQAMKNELLDSGGRTDEKLLSYIRPECVRLNLAGETKEEIITELVDILVTEGRVLRRDLVLHDVFEREKAMGTGMSNGIALPHAKTDGVDDLEVAIGIKKEGIDFGAMDGKKSRIFILIISPQKDSGGPHLQFLACISSILLDPKVRVALINIDSPEKAVELLHEEAKFKSGQ